MDYIQTLMTNPTRHATVRKDCLLRGGYLLRATRIANVISTRGVAGHVHCSDIYLLRPSGTEQKSNEVAFLFLGTLSNIDIRFPWMNIVCNTCGLALTQVVCTDELKRCVSLQKATLLL
jgi:hypothetical protein